MSFILFFIVNLGFWIIITVFMVSFGVGFAFIKYNGRPLYVITLLALKFAWKPKMFLWKRSLTEQVYNIPTGRPEAKGGPSVFPGFSKISQLWQNLTTSKNPIPKREKPSNVGRASEIQEQYQVYKKISGEKETAKRVDYR